MMSVKDLTAKITHKDENLHVSFNTKCKFEILMKC